MIENLATDVATRLSEKYDEHFKKACDLLDAGVEASIKHGRNRIDVVKREHVLIAELPISGNTIYKVLREFDIPSRKRVITDKFLSSGERRHSGKTSSFMAGMKAEPRAIYLKSYTTIGCIENTTTNRKL